ncbi:hypothetical protein JCGZ_19325 [Jatropha curcas]|uniref:Uncharacterized protein n=1 Tax=Jatropha curcas TaxID=180498 RepID=A0A067JZT1_JATCU|nr:hypothetical protein JCGZ_19325 [Jatropha curcas]
MAFINQVSSFVQSIPHDLWQIHPMNQLAWLKYFKELKPDYGFLSWLVRYFNPNTDAGPYGNIFHELYDKFWKRSKIKLNSPLWHPKLKEARTPIIE